MRDEPCGIFAKNRAYEAAYERECASITAKLTEMAAAIQEPADIWSIHDFLTRRRREIDRKYNYRYSVLLQVFARLLREGWLCEASLEGLNEDKIETIKRCASLYQKH